jgi:hypothetical protein
MMAACATLIGETHLQFKIAIEAKSEPRILGCVKTVRDEKRGEHRKVMRFSIFRTVHG